MQLQKIFMYAGVVATVFIFNAHASGFDVAGGYVTATSIGISQSTQTTQVNGSGAYTASSSASNNSNAGLTALYVSTTTNNSTVTANLSNNFISIDAISKGGVGAAGDGDIVYGGASGIIDFSIANSSNILINFDGSDWAYATISGPSGFDINCDWTVAACKGAMSFSAGNYELSFNTRDTFVAGVHLNSNMEMSLAIQSGPKVDPVPLPATIWLFVTGLLGIGVRAGLKKVPAFFIHS